MKHKIVAIFRLLRVRQWYKNVVMFFGIFFGGKLFDFSLYPQLFLGLLAMCLMSSLNYIQNDINDIEKDKLHEEKRKKRPLANGDLSKRTACFIFSVIAALEIYLIFFYYFNAFSLILIAVYLNGMLYNYVFKKIAFADIIALSMIYVWRTIGGCVLIHIMISPWLFIVVFLIALFLASAKRMADFRYLGEEKASAHKKVYDQYSVKLLDFILIISSTSLFVSYMMYCVFGPEDESSIIPQENSSLFLYSAPIALYLIMRLIYLIYAKPEIARDMGKFIHDKGLIWGGIFLVIILMIALYFSVGSISEALSRIIH